jgi:hypothetical protein
MNGWSIWLISRFLCRAFSLRSAHGCHEDGMTTLPPRALTIGLGASLLLSACATVSPESRLRAGLLEAGLSPRMSSCMAEKMVDRLDIVQLRRLQSLASLRKSHMGDMTVDRFLYKVRAMEDPEIFSVTSKAALICAIDR